jgi:hypothetical protein
MADKEGSADWKRLVDFHARVLKEEKGERAQTRERGWTITRHSTGGSPKHIFFIAVEVA